MFPYDFEITHEKGERMTIVDILSRITKFADEPKRWHRWSREYVLKMEDIKKEAKESPEYRRMVKVIGRPRKMLPVYHPGRHINTWDEYYVEDNLIYDEKDWIVILRGRVKRPHGVQNYMEEHKEVVHMESSMNGGGRRG